MSTFYLRQIQAGQMANFVYLVGDDQEKKCLIIDPAWAVNEILHLARQDGMEVTGALITHTHYDHVNGLEDLLEAAGPLPIYVHEAEHSVLKDFKPHLHLTREGSELRVGGLKIQCLHTPGHSRDSQCFLLEGYVFTGDTLFVNACGRYDFPSSSGKQMFESLKRLSELPPETIVLPGHHYGDKPHSTIAQEKKHNPYFQFKSLNEFLQP